MPDADCSEPIADTLVPIASHVTGSAIYISPPFVIISRGVILLATAFVLKAEPLQKPIGRRPIHMSHRLYAVEPVALDKRVQAAEHGPRDQNLVPAGGLSGHNPSLSDARPERVYAAGANDLATLNRSETVIGDHQLVRQPTELKRRSVFLIVHSARENLICVPGLERDDAH